MDMTSTRVTAIAAVLATILLVADALEIDTAERNAAFIGYKEKDGESLRS